MSQLDPPKVSVIIPARNRHELLQRALRSVRNQIGVETEIIVVDDASDPPLEGLLDDQDLEHLRILRNPVRRNAAYSRNLGVRAARFPYLAFLDSDDVWFPSHLSIGARALGTPSSDALYVARFGSLESVDERPAEVHGDGYEFLFGRIGDPRSSTLMCGRAFFDKIRGFDESLEKYQDWDFFLRCALVGRVLFGRSGTVFLDETAAGRMSARLDLEASRQFLDSHAGNMSVDQLSVFFSGLLIAAATKAGKDYQESRRLFLEYLGWSRFPLRYWPLLVSPAVGAASTRIWLRLKSLYLRMGREAQVM